MVRNKEIQRIFEIADDSLQGFLGYYFYVMALYKSGHHPNNVEPNLPNMSQKVGIEAFPHTFSWIRYYRKMDLISTFMPPYFEFYQSRISLTAIVSVFDDALDKFVIKLKNLGFSPRFDGKEFDPKKNSWKYKKRIEWAFSESKECTIGDVEAIKRLPKTFGIIDEARLLRNLLMHNHGIFNKNYEKDAIKSKDFERVEHPGYTRFRDSGKDVTVIINYADIINFSLAHIETLHILHNQIQKKYFHYLRPYDYREENKIIRWDSALWAGSSIYTVIDDIKRMDSYLKV